MSPAFGVIHQAFVQARLAEIADRALQRGLPELGYDPALPLRAPCRKERVQTGGDQSSYPHGCTALRTSSSGSVATPLLKRKKEESSVKWILAIATLALAALALEDKSREVARDARVAAGEAADQAREATGTLSRNVEQQPLSAILIASILGYVLARLVPRR